ncbi:ParB N-terminal domain-containing protein [Nocardia sp. CS682]|uniref:ParB/RepB/Spo0J family partition protein n=1 Tax=Nocardia sp. CS682 TaxID=1047172 RepID=UPI00197E8E31|nr:ParB N-terminal domain-containing protein [Nocardia sp. CS682]
MKQQPGSSEANSTELVEESNSKPLSRLESLLVPIASLLPADSPRFHGINEDYCRCLSEVETATPPILVHRRTMRVIDGMHRLYAAKLAGADTIQVRFFDGDESEAFICAVKENNAHGLPLSLAERVAAARRIIESSPALSNRAIAGYVGLSDKTVGAVRAHGSTSEHSQLSSRIGADGKVRPLDPEMGRRRAAEILDERPNASLREIAVGAGISVGTAHDVRKRIRNGESPIPSHRRRIDADDRTPLPSGDVSDASLARKRVSREVLPQEIDLSILQRLAKDPSLRHSESGRELLRFLNTYVVRDSPMKQARTVPPHCVESVIQLARQCGNAWLRFAHDVEAANHVAH